MAVRRVTRRRGNAAARIKQIGERMTGSVKVGFLEGATYPQDDARYLKRLKSLRKFREQARIAAAEAENVRRRIVGLNVKPIKPKSASKFVGPPKPPGILPVATVAAWDEWGHGATPARPFFRQTIAAGRSTWGKNVLQIAKANSYNGDVVLEKMGTLIKDQITTAIVQWPADNAALTVKIKGFNKGLEDRGIMQRSVDFEVQK
jgi:hypothetical protein